MTVLLKAGCDSLSNISKVIRNFDHEFLSADSERGETNFLSWVENEGEKGERAQSLS